MTLLVYKRLEQWFPLFVTLVRFLFTALFVHLIVKQYHFKKVSQLGVAVKVFKNGCNGGIGVGFIMGGWEISQVSLHSWQRGANPFYFEDLSLYCLLPPFFKFCPTSHRPISCCLQSSPPLPPPPCHCSFCFHVSLAELVIMQYLMRYFT